MERLPQYSVKDIMIDNNSFIKVRADQSMKKLYCQTKNTQSPVFQALKAKCDVVPNQYEGIEIVAYNELHIHWYVTI